MYWTKSKFLLRIKKNRNCNVKDIVVDKKNDIEIDFRIDNGECGGIVDEYTDNNYKYRGKQLQTAKIIKLKTKLLNMF